MLLSDRQDERDRRPDFHGGRGCNLGVSGLFFSVSGRDGVRYAGCGGASAWNRRRIRLWRGHDDGSVMTIRVFFSTMVAASLIKWRRKVSNCACRHGDRFGQAARSVHQSQ